MGTAARSELLQHGNERDFLGGSGDRMSIWWLAAIPSIAVLVGIQFFLYHTLVDREIKRCHYGRAVKMIDGLLGWSSTGVVRLQKRELYSTGAGLRKPK